MNYFTHLTAHMRTIIPALWVFILLISGMNTASAQYCTSGASNTADEEIVSVVLKGNTVLLNNSSPYHDSTILVPMMMQQVLASGGILRRMNSMENCHCSGSTETMSQNMVPERSSHC